jgi:Tol biopolymer transport system component
MKRCPECARDYNDDSLSYCLDDGTPLVQGTISDEPATAILSGNRVSGEELTRSLKDGDTATFDKRSSRLSTFFLRERLPWIAAAIFLFASLALLPFAITNLRQPNPGSSAIVRYEIPPPDKTVLNLIRWPSLTVSPDGSTLAFVASSDGISRLYVRRRDDTDVRLLEGTEGASYPVFSPDNKSLAFIADFTLKKASFDGPVTVLGRVNDVRGLSWAGNDSIIYTPHVSEPLYQISVHGGEPQQVSTLDESRGERTHRWPQVLPGGKAVLFTVGTLNSPDDYEQSNIEAVVLATGERRVLLQGASMARYSPTGHLVFARGGNLFAVGFDADTLTTQGSPVTVLQGVAGDQTTGMAQFSIANDGTMAYIPGGPGANMRQLVWADHGGNLQPVNLQPAQYNDIRVSPDGSRVALLIGSSGSGDVWVFDFERETSTRLTFDTVNASPVWSSDGKSIFYTAIDPAGTKSAVLRKPADGSREAEVVVSLPGTAYIKAIEPDGSSVMIDHQVNTNRADIVQLRLEQGAEISPIVKTPFHEYSAALSPDGRWLAYQSNESGRPEIYVRDLSESGGRWQISTGGGVGPRWSPDGRELYFRFNDLFMSVAVEARPAFQAGTSKRLFSGIYNLSSASGVSYDVDPKGGRFLMLRPMGDPTARAQVRVVLNWSDELRRLAPIQ